MVTSQLVIHLYLGQPIIQKVLYESTAAVSNQFRTHVAVFFYMLQWGTGTHTS